MASARTVLAVLGLVFAVAGLAVAWTFDSLTGPGVLLIDALLPILPFTRLHDDE